MQIVISDNRLLRLTQVYEPQSSVISQHFRAKDRSAHFKRAMTNSSWDGYRKFYNDKTQTIRKAFLRELVDLCEKNDFPYEILNEREKPKFPIPAPGSFDNQLIDGLKAYDWQMRCWEAVCKGGYDIFHEIGTHFHPTGSGKSIMMAGLVKILRCPTMIVTEQSIILSQIVRTLKINNVVHHDDIGEFYSGKMPDGNLVCVGSISAIQTPKKPKYDSFKVKLATLQNNFKKMLKSDPKELQGLISVKGVFAWLRSNIIDEVSKQYAIGKIFNGITDDISEWEGGTDFIVYDRINNLSQERFIEILGEKNWGIWRQTEFVSKSFEKDLAKALFLMDKYLKNKFYNAAVAGHKTLKVKVKELHKMVSNCELLIVDEMDNASSKLYKPLFDKLFKGRYIHGFSGTPYDPDTPVDNMVVKSRFGSVISYSTRREVEDAGLIQPIKYYMMQFGEFSPKDKTAFDIAEREIIIDNEDFYKVLKSVIMNWPNEKHLVIVDTSNIEDVGKQLESKIPNSKFIYGKVSPKKRMIIIDQFEKGDINVLIVSKIGKRGMDLGGGAHNAYLIGGGKRSSNFDQIIGRAVRLNDRGWARVIDFYFTGNYYLLDHSRKRLKFINAMGYNAQVIFGKDYIKVSKFIKSRYRLPKSFKK